MNIDTRYVTRFYVIYQNPSDIECNFVYREWLLFPDQELMVAKVGCIHATLEEARADLPETRVSVPLSVDEDPVIAEVWVV